MFTRTGLAALAIATLLVPGVTKPDLAHKIAQTIARLEPTRAIGI
jgi:hypothetical protein